MCVSIAFLPALVWDLIYIWKLRKPFQMGMNSEQVASEAQWETKASEEEV